MKKTVLIIGLGLIGGSIAKALAKNTNYHIVGMDTDISVCKKALGENAINEIGNDESIKQADLIFLCIYPQAAIDFTRKNANSIRKDAIVCDVAGIKKYICAEMTELSAEFGFTFIGTHPMAGKEKGGFENSESGLFLNSSFIIIPCGADDKKVKIVSDLAVQMGFARIVISTPQEHDAMIAFTSQVPHILANAYVQSPKCLNHKGFSAGSYRDVSRVARINELLWSELFLENKDELSKELKTLIENITALSDAVSSGDRDTLIKLLRKGTTIKEVLGE